MIYIDTAYALIEEKRQEMIKVAEEFGMTSRKTLEISQELDLLMNSVSTPVFPVRSIYK